MWFVFFVVVFLFVVGLICLFLMFFELLFVFVFVGEGEEVKTCSVMCLNDGSKILFWTTMSESEFHIIRV